MSKQAQDKAFKERKNKFEKSIDTWTEEEIREHLEQVDRFYGTGMAQANYLGDFSHDPNNVYYWHVVDKNHENKLNRRRAIGWGLASQEDIAKAGITTTSKYGEIDSNTSAVIANHGGDTKAILLKIPRKLHELNEEVKRARSAKSAGIDVRGALANYREKVEGNKIVRHRDEGEISMENI